MEEIEEGENLLLFDSRTNKIHPYDNGYWKRHETREITTKSSSSVIWKWAGYLPSDGFIYGDKKMLLEKEGNFTFVYTDLKTGLQVYAQQEKSDLPKHP